MLALLLVVRAWAGDAMALGLPHGAAPAVSVAAPAPCHEARADAAHAHGEPGAAAHGDVVATDAGGGACSACQICHSLALAAFATFARPGVAPRVAPRGAPTRFASAEPRRQHKPPIA